MPDSCTGSRANWLKTATFFNTLAGKLAPHGMFTGYHNHHTEFTPLDGECPWDILIGNTRKEVVAQLDTGNALYGGADPLPLLQRYPGRARSIHLKPFTKGTPNPEDGFRPVIGEDDIPWSKILQFCKSAGGTEWYIIEYECPAYPPLDAVARCLNGLRQIGK